MGTTAATPATAATAGGATATHFWEPNRNRSQRWLWGPTTLRFSDATNGAADDATNDAANDADALWRWKPGGDERICGELGLIGVYYRGILTNDREFL